LIGDVCELEGGVGGRKEMFLCVTDGSLSEEKCILNLMGWFK
jgi:hypothetical protein